jgi:hypothetical protein
MHHSPYVATAASHGELWRRCQSYGSVSVSGIFFLITVFTRIFTH